jgi:pyrimidine-nucleoside phosphorylase
MHIIELIEQKRSGKPLDTRQIQWLVRGAVQGEIPDYQLASLLMVICYEGLSLPEVLALTEAFVESGDQLAWEFTDRPVVDKHSTGGVGDKVSLLLVPWLAAAGCIVPKMSGRGLGHTGGTVDKLESIPGFRTDLARGEIQAQLEFCGCVIVAQTENLVPADRLFYALRDATATVNEQGLIAASIMSKKIAGGAQHIVLDVKRGAGAFFMDEGQARSFAELAVRIGDHFRRRISWVISPMDAPLGSAVGNGLEVEEAMSVAEHRMVDHPLVENCLELGWRLLTSAAIRPGEPAARELLLELLENGAVYSRMQQWIEGQGGRIAEFREVLAREKRARRFAVPAGREGTVRSIDALAVGRLANQLGAGRARKEDPVDPFAGLELSCGKGSLLDLDSEIGALYPGPACTLGRDEMIAALQSAVVIES